MKKEIVCVMANCYILLFVKDKITRKINDEKDGESYEGEDNSNFHSLVLLKIFKKARIFFLEKVKNIDNTHLVLCENVINFKEEDIDYVCGVFPLLENCQTLEESL
jgi:hypothetical protein